MDGDGWEGTKSHTLIIELKILELTRFILFPLMENFKKFILLHAPFTYFKITLLLINMTVCDITLFYLDSSQSFSYMQIYLFFSNGVLSFYNTNFSISSQHSFPTSKFNQAAIESNSMHACYYYCMTGEEITL